MVQLKIEASYDHVLFMTLLCLDASFAMTPYATSNSCWNHARVLRPKPENRPPVVLRPKPPNHSRVAYSICSPHELDTCHHRPRLPNHQVLQHLHLTCPTTILTWLTRSIPHVLLHLSMTLGVSHPRSVTRLLQSLGPSLSIHPSPLLVH